MTARPSAVCAGMSLAYHASTIDAASSSAGAHSVIAIDSMNAPNPQPTRNADENTLRNTAAKKFDAFFSLIAASHIPIVNSTKNAQPTDQPSIQTLMNPANAICSSGSIRIAPIHAARKMIAPTTRGFRFLPNRCP